jgi:hypothetical protein
LSWGLFHSSNHELDLGPCTKKLSGGVQKKVSNEEFLLIKRIFLSFPQLLGLRPTTEELFATQYYLRNKVCFTKKNHHIR